MENVMAVYEKGVLRPKTPLSLAEGELVSVSVTPIAQSSRLEGWEQRLQNAKSINDWVVLANTCPEQGTDLDISKVINESRRQTGFRMPDPEPTAGK